MNSSQLQIMTPLLHFLQLLCENHNILLQVSDVFTISCVEFGIWGGGGGRRVERGVGEREKRQDQQECVTDRQR